jgi:mannose/fructose/N-acetylgalactosamine-specific phosphotransferase system component IIB
MVNPETANPDSINKLQAQEIFLNVCQVGGIKHIICKTKIHSCVALGKEHYMFLKKISKKHRELY